MQVAPGLVGPAGLRTAHRDELAPPHELPKAQGSYPITSDGSRCAVQHDRSADVRFGSKADILHRLGDVRFTPKSGHS